MNEFTQVFCLGSSYVYGVGAEEDGWADLIKKHFHEKMYGSNGIGEKCEVYNFGKPGATVDFVKKYFPILAEAYGRSQKVITIVAVGGNNNKAVNKPDNFVSTIEEYKKEMEELLEVLKKSSTHVIAVGGGWYDETKTYPKLDPLTDSLAYHTNERRIMFENCFENLCNDKGITFIKTGVEEDEWKSKYQYKDGIHANQAGHELIVKKILAEIEGLMYE